MSSATALGTDWTDRMLELEVGPVAHGGHCVARADGRVVFVRHALPGERVRAVVTEDGGGSFCRADAVEVLDASPYRVEAPCSWAACGRLRRLRPAARRPRRAARPQGRRRSPSSCAGWPGSSGGSRVEELPGGPLGWRHRVRLAVDEQGRAGLRAHRSHDVLPIADCPLTPPGPLPPVLEHGFDPGTEVEVAVDADGRGPRRADDGPVIQRAAGPGLAALARRVLAGPPGARRTPSPPWWASGRTRRGAASPGTSTAASGSSPPCWPIRSGPDGMVTVVESSRQAVADGKAALADLPQVGWRVGRVERVLGSLGPRPDVVVADPPRRGLGRELVDALCARAPDRVVHVACDPAALARDVALFAERGFRLAELRAFDAFPMTHHFECVALLVRD